MKGFDMTQSYLKEWLSYDSDTGVFVRAKKRPNGGANNNIGDKVGSIDSLGYWSLSLNGERIKLHRAAWLYENGALPDGQIDHIDRNKSNNAISNLRDVTRNINMRNRDITSDNTSGRAGVYWRKDRGYWEASIKVKQDDTTIRKCIKGASFEDACRIRASWEQELEFQPK